MPLARPLSLGGWMVDGWLMGGGARGVFTAQYPNGWVQIFKLSIFFFEKWNGKGEKQDRFQNLRVWVRGRIWLNLQTFNQDLAIAHVFGCIDFMLSLVLNQVHWHLVRYQTCLLEFRVCSACSSHRSWFVYRYFLIKKFNQSGAKFRRFQVRFNTAAPSNKLVPVVSCFSTR